MKIFTLLFALILTFQIQGQSLDETIASEMELENIPSVSTAIIKDGKVIWHKQFGYADIASNTVPTDTTVYLLASVSKLFTGTAAMQLVEENELDLDADINNYLTFDIKNPNHTNTPITLRQLLTHTSSILDADVMDNYYTNNQDPTMSLDEIMNRYFNVSGEDYSASDNFSNQAPGTIYEYSNIATALVAYIVEEVSEQDFKAYCDENIFEPLCMVNTSWRFADYQLNQLATPYQYTGGNYQAYEHYTFADYPNGGLRSTSSDLLKFLQMYLNDGTFDGNVLLATSTIEDMLTPQVANLEETQGLSWYTEEFTNATLWTHNGGESGVSTDVLLDKENDIAVIVLSNGEGDCYYIADAMYDYALSASSNDFPEVSCEMPLSSIYYPIPKSLNYYTADQQLVLNNTEELDLNVEIFEITGRLLAKEKSNDSKIHLNLEKTHQILLVSISGEGINQTIKWLN